MTKENTVATFLKEKFPNVTWKCNKSVENGCSRRRPDLFLGMRNHIVIVEVDEHSHVGYDPTCEEKRLEEIFTIIKLYLFGSIPMNTGMKKETTFRHRGG